MRKLFWLVTGLTVMAAGQAYAQLGMFSKEQRVELTREWNGERFADGRPKVPDALLEQLKTVDAEEAWGVLRGGGYPNQFEGGWKVINPGERLVGRVVTAVFMPLRPDVNAVINEHGKQEERVGAQNSWVIDILQPGDVLVVDLFGKIQDGTFAGDNLGTAIFAKSHTGLIVDGAIRDVTGMSEIKGFHVYVRDFDPSALRNVMLMGITFIPPQLAEKVASSAEMTHLVDEWGHMMLREGKYTPGEIDRKWTKPMIEEFNRWLEQKGSKRRMKEE